MIKLKNMIKPALVGGLALGLGGGIISTLLNLAPYSICLNLLSSFVWPLAAGLLAAFLLHKKSRLTMSDGAVVGALAGIVEAVSHSFLNILVTIITSVLKIGQGLNPVKTIPGVPMLTEGAVITIVILIAILIFQLILYTIIAAIGGVVGAAVLDRNKKGSIEQHAGVE